jgi:hypothetical protein
MCIPALFHTKSNLLDPSEWDNTWEWIEKFLEYYQKLGVGRFFLYTVGPRTELNTQVPHSWINVSWVPDVDKSRKKRKGMWYYGQYWTVNDCLYRNKALGTDWVVFQDYDEIFVSPKYQTLTNLVNLVGGGEGERVEEDNGLPDTILFGRKVSGMHDCTELKSAEDWSTCDRYERATQAECYRKNQDPNLCVSFVGRRKHVDRVASVYLTKVHKVLSCNDDTVGSCKEVNADARDLWLDHYRGQPYNHTSKQCLCQ